jgi:uncharacterized protein YdeI (YjbR/CyaY-like superfamily)
MEISQTLYVTNRRAWRSWLARNHVSAKEIWLVYPKKHARKPRIPYNSAVEEALCFGWIDSTIKRFDDDRIVQRFSPRRTRSGISEMNKERVRRLIAAGKMTRAGLAKIKTRLEEPFRVAPDILRALKADASVWQHYQSFQESYQRIRIGWIEGARGRDEIFATRLAYFLRMTAQNKQFGMVR